MIIKKNILAGVALAIGLSSCVVNVEDQIIDKEALVNASSFTSLTFDGGDLADKLVIHGDSQDSLTAFARASVWANSDEDAKRIAEGMNLKWSGTSDARLAIEYPGSEKEFVRIEKLSIDAPQRLDVNIDLSSADLDISNMKGNVNVDVSSGDVKVSTEGRVNVESSSGDVTVTTGKGGDLDVSSGDIRMDVTNRNFENVHIESSSGNVTINIADGAGIDFELETSSGVVAINYGGFSTIEHEGSITVSVNGGGRKVYVSSSSGDIQISKL
jgi:hypothetical protein